MITGLEITNLKGFDKYEVDFDRVNLLVGGNNSGKTTIFHALQVAFWCIEQTSEVTGGRVKFRKTQVPELGAIPYFNTRDLFYQQRMRRGKAPTRITITLKTTATPDLTFKIYGAFSRNLMVDGGNATMTQKAFKSLLRLRPVYVPGTIGITVREELYREVAQQRLILEGRQNEVLRNLIYRLNKGAEWKEFISIVNPLFELEGITVPFDEATDEWLTAVYRENKCEFDFVSAGSGFLQVMNLLSFLFLHASGVALLDEPDSHMHDDLQRLTFDILDELSHKRNIQLIIATHSPTLIDAAGLENVLVIDRQFSAPLRAKEVETLVPLLADRGLALPPARVMNTLTSRRVLFVENNEADYLDFIQKLGEVHSAGFRTITRGLTVLETRGETGDWPLDAITYFERLVGVPLKYVYVSDRDFRTDEQVGEREQRAHSEDKCMVHLDRRHREAYLLVPEIISRVLAGKWEKKHPGQATPEQMTREGLESFVLGRARELNAKTRTDLLVQQEPSLRGPSSERAIATLALTEHFEQQYVQPLSRDEIPYKLLNAKQVLKDLRTEISDRDGISFSDRDILNAYTAEEIPQDLCTILDLIRGMFEEE